MIVISHKNSNKKGFCKNDLYCQTHKNTKFKFFTFEDC